MLIVYSAGGYARSSRLAGDQNPSQQIVFYPAVWGVLRCFRDVHARHAHGCGAHISVYIHILREQIRLRSQMQSLYVEPCIYIVDDESALAQMAHHILSLRGYSASVFDDPAKALQHLKNSPSDTVLLITDCIMGSMNGLELIEEFQKRVKSLRTILLSGTITDDFVRKCQVQPDRFLAKPYGADALLDIVDELVGRKTAAVSSNR